MKIAVTGSGGFIGRHLVARLLKKHEVVKIPTISLSDANQLVDFLHGVDAIFHLAAYGNHSHQDSALQTIEANINVLIRLLKIARTNNVKRFYNVSTSSVSLPNQTLYSISKRAGEEICKLYDSEEMRVISVRPYSVYGPGEADDRFIPTMIKKILLCSSIELDPDAVHDWIYVEDFVSALLRGTLHAGTGKQYTNLEVLQALCFIAGKKVRYTKKKFKSYDTTEWKAPVGVPHRDLIDGLKLTWLHYAHKYRSEIAQSSVADQ